MAKTITLRRFKTWLLWLLIIGKLLIILEVYALMQQGGYTPANFWGILAIVVPLFAAYITPLFTNLSKSMIIMPEKESDQDDTQQPKDKAEPMVSRGWVVAMILIIVAYVLWMMIWIAKFSNSFDQQSLKSLQQALLLGETLLGGYIGSVIAVVTKDLSKTK